MGKIVLKDLEVGQYRHLTKEEVAYLKSNKVEVKVMKVGKYLTKITDINKLYLEKVINKGDIVVDATMGNGYEIQSI